MVAGQVGFTGHIEIADGVKIGAQSGVHRALTKPGATYFGTPAYPQREAMRIYGSLPAVARPAGNGPGPPEASGEARTADP